MDELKEYFRNLRFSKNHHLGLGDVRLTLAMQEEIIAIAERSTLAGTDAWEPCGHHRTLGEMRNDLEGAGYVVIDPDEIDSAAHGGSCPYCERTY